jgi:hypothetical protein
LNRETCITRANKHTVKKKGRSGAAPAVFFSVHAAKAGRFARFFEAAATLAARIFTAWHSELLSLFKNFPALFLKIIK